MNFGTVAQRVEDDAGLDASVFLLNVKLKNLIHVLREIQNHRDVAGLSGKACARASGENGSAEFSACGDRRDHISGIARNNEADRNLTIIRRVGGIECATAAIEAHFAAHAALQFALEFGGLRKRVNCLSVRAWRQWSN